MEFIFDAQQEYQVQAIEAVMGLLEGQPRNELDVTFSLSGFASVPNILNLTEETLLRNLRAIQEQNNISPLDDALQCIEADIETADGLTPARFANFSIEMETGTGKTYVYIRTALELYRRNGLRKFIIVVPSVAVREGVLKTLQITEMAQLEAEIESWKEYLTGQLFWKSAMPTDSHWINPFSI